MNKNFWFFRYRYLIIGLSILLTVFSAIPMFWINIDSDLRNYFPKEMEALKNTTRIEESFGTTEPVLLLLESDNIVNKATLDRFSKICSAIEEQDWTEKVISVFNSKYIHSGGGFMLVDPAIPYIPQTAAEQKNVTELIDRNPLVSGFLVSKNHQYTMAMISKTAQANDIKIYESIDSILKANPGKDKIYVAGEPQLRVVVNKDVNKDLIVLMPIGILLMLMFLWIAFKNFRAVIIPLLVVLISIVFSIGLMPLLGWNVSIISILIPVMMLAIANNYGVHFVEAYREEVFQNPDTDKIALINSIFQRLKNPVLLTGLTTIAGILTMVTHVMIPARQTGVVAGWGITIALIFSLLLVPVLLVLSNKKHFLPLKRPSNSTNVPKLLHKAALFIVNHTRLILVGGVLFAIIAGLGVIGLKVDPNAENVLPAKHEFLQANKLINENFGGSKNFSIMVEGDIKDPDLLKDIDHLEKELKKLPQVGNVVSIATVLRTMSTALYESTDSMYNKIPDTREAVAQMFELYSMGGDPADFEQLVDFNFERTVISVQFKAATNNDYKVVFNKMDELIPQINAKVIYGGYALITYKMIDAIIRGQIYSLILSVIIVFLLLLWIFRSWRYALIGCIPLSVTILVMFGLMGYFGFPIDIVSAIISSIVVGIGVDYTIHFLWRYRLEKQNGLSNKESVYKTLTTTGKGIIINSISVMIGFTALLFSSFAALKSFSFLIITALLVCLIFSLVVIPVMCLLIPKLK